MSSTEGAHNSYSVKKGKVPPFGGEGGHVSPPFETGFPECKPDCIHIREVVYKSFGYRLTECCKFTGKDEFIWIG